MKTRSLMVVLAPLLLLMPACGGEEGGEPSEIPDGTGIPVECGDSKVTVRGELEQGAVSANVDSNFMIAAFDGLEIELFEEALAMDLDAERVVGDPQPATGTFTLSQHAYCTGEGTTVQWSDLLTKVELRNLRLRGACPGGTPVTGSVGGSYGYDWESQAAMGTMSGPGFSDAAVTGYSLSSRGLGIEFEGGTIQVSGYPDADTGLLYLGDDIYCLAGLGFGSAPDLDLRYFTASEVSRLATCDEASATPGYLNVCVDSAR